MANITAALVKELRERTGAGMMDCKKALVAADGDIEVAIDNMRKNGQAKAAKKAGRVTAEGVIAYASNENKAYIVEINCETDFVAKDAGFNEFCNNVARVALDKNVADVEALKNETYPGTSDSVQTVLTNLIAKIGENMSIRRVASLEGSNLGIYIHSNKLIGVIASLEGGDAQLSHDIAMHICASAPQYITKEEAPQDQIEHERQIQTEITEKEEAENVAAGKKAKPANVLANIIEGRINKRFDELSLVTQDFVKDGTKKVGQVLKEGNATVKTFVRFKVGEGIEKKEVDFAAEVAAQVAAAQGK